MDTLTAPRTDQAPAAEAPSTAAASTGSPATEAEALGTWLRLCALDALDREWGAAALIENGEPGGHQLAIFRLWDDRVFVTDNVDPHTGAAVMSRGIVGDKGGNPTVASPLLKAVFDLETGDSPTHPDLHLITYPVRITEGAVEVLFPA
ncbi:nitrite reductase small subunit NirD [Brevibacterium litoralis]|uniref:nitrite reductase small subunit NirD n=1 Tax=Brevibacterium litoralis TaxID=3138935 RepID=UPI0032EC8E3B